MELQGHVGIWHRQPDRFIQGSLTVNALTEGAVRLEAGFRALELPFVDAEVYVADPFDEQPVRVADGGVAEVADLRGADQASLS